MVHGAPSPTRTGDLRIRSPTLYPSELWALPFGFRCLLCREDFNLRSNIMTLSQIIGYFHSLTNAWQSRRDIDRPPSNSKIHGFSLISPHGYLLLIKTLYFAFKKE